MAHKAKTSNPIPATDALIGDEEKKRTESRKKEKQGAGPQPSFPVPFGRLLQPPCIIITIMIKE